MHLPENVLFCIERLEKAGFAAYAVGGCVRDWLWGQAPHDFDLCTAAKPAQTAALFADFGLVHSGEKHGTIGVIFGKEVVEITTFRTEGDYADNRHPDWVEFVSDIRADLSRRDFTVNAMAYSPTRGLCDPFGGQQDLEKRILRAVGDPEKRFREDALRILRGVRFSVRYGLTPEEDTLQAMEKTAPLMDTLAAERVFDELCKLLPLVSAEDLQRFAPILVQTIPELKPCLGFHQRNPHHAYDVYTHTAHVVQAVPPELALRWAALLHDIGKPCCFSLDDKGIGHFYGHAAQSAHLAEQILLRLRCRTTLRKSVVTLIEQHMTPLEPDRKLLRRRVSRLSMDMTRQLLQLQQADMGGKGKEKSKDFERIAAILQELEAEKACLGIKDLAVNGHDLMALGLTGPQIGKTLEKLLQLVLDERLPNEKEALLQACVKEDTP